jgi:hypothetical protein
MAERGYTAWPSSPHDPAISPGHGKGRKEARGRGGHGKGRRGGRGRGSGSGSGRGRGSVSGGRGRGGWGGNSNSGTRAAPGMPAAPAAPPFWSPEVCVFNRPFQDILDRISDETILQEADAFDSLTRLARDFEHAALQYGSIIIAERSLPERNKVSVCRSMYGVFLTCIVGRFRPFVP